tara:strand:- start:23059 stop:25776 length:2718 start_codon:yes stop_codon:yes gene_type:complete
LQHPSPNLVVGFRAGRVPRFEDPEDDLNFEENVQKQRVLWTSLVRALCEANSQLEDAQRVWIEVRYTAPDSNQSIYLDVLCWSCGTKDSVATNGIASIVTALLPEEYAWLPLKCGSIEFAEGKGWQVARISRRLEFVSLPMSEIDFDDESRPTRAGTDPLGASTRLRQLPTADTDPEFVKVEPHCLPVLADLQIEPFAMRRVLGQMLRLSPGVVSVTLSPTDLTDLRQFQRIASFWYGFSMRRTDTVEENGPTVSLVDVEDSYRRFVVPETNLCRLSFRIAASTKSAANALALHMAGRMGGVDRFDITTFDNPPTRAEFPDPWDDVPSNAWPDDYWREEAAATRAQLARQEIDDDIDEGYLHFLAGFPFLYDGEEASQILDLPRALRDGLPGVDTKPIAPFTSNIGSPFTVVGPDGKSFAPPPADRMRIGAAHPGGGGAAAPTEEAFSSDAFVGQFERAVWHTMPVNDLNKHALIVGSTGSGKTQSVLFLLRELMRLKIPVLIVEPVKTEYHDLLTRIPGIEVRRHRFEGTPEGKPVDDFLAFDPMHLQPGVSVARHASYLKSCFESAFPLDNVLALIMEAGIRSYYTSPRRENGCNLRLFARGGPQVHKSFPVEGGHRWITHPSLEMFFRHFKENYLPTVVKATKGQGQLAELQEQWKQIFERRFDAVYSGMIGKAARKANERLRESDGRFNGFGDLLDGINVLELDAIPDDDQKSLMMSFILMFLFERRQAEDLSLREKGHDPDDSLKHVVIIEEAHRLLANVANNSRGDLAGASAKAKAVSMFTDMLAEIRAFGQGLVIVEQIPTKIAVEAVKNTNLKIMLRLTAEDDRQYLGEAMNFTEEEKSFVTSLRAEPGRGIDMVVFEQQLDQPKLLTLPLNRRVPGAAPHDILFQEPFDAGLKRDE